VPEKAPENFSGVFYTKSKTQQTPAPVVPPQPVPPPQPESGLPIAVPSAEQLGGMLNGLVGNIFENNNWWLWAAILIIFINPDLRKKLIGKGKEAD